MAKPFTSFKSMKNTDQRAPGVAALLEQASAHNVTLAAVLEQTLAVTEQVLRGQPLPDDEREKWLASLPDLVRLIEDTRRAYGPAKE